MAEMNGALQPGSQPASGGMNSGSGSGSVAGGFEMVAVGMGGGAGVSPPSSNVGVAGLSMTDITLEQALARLHELVRENAELREYLKENNEMMKKQFETLSQWKQKVHEANVMNREKFEQTRALITALRSENEELQEQTKESEDKKDALNGKVKSLEMEANTLKAELNTLKTAKAASDQLAYNVVKQAEQQGVEVGEEENQMRDTVFVASAEKEERIMELEAEVDRMNEELQQMKEHCAHLEHDNTQFRGNTEQLLKDLEATQELKQQIQKENQDLRQETVELQQQLQKVLTESKNSLQRTQKLPTVGVQQYLQAKEERNMPIYGNNGEGAMGQTPDHTVDDWQKTSGAVTAELDQLRKQLATERQQVEILKADQAGSQLEISRLVDQMEQQKTEMSSLQARHDEKIRQVQREHVGQVEQIERQLVQESMPQSQATTATHAEDVQTLRSQVLTLINEVHETQNKLAAAQRVIESKSARVRELETYSSQIVQDSRGRLQQLQQALSNGERHILAEQQAHAATKQQMNDLRQSFNQLVSDYKELLDSFDKYKAEQDQRAQSSTTQKQHMDTINHLTAQVLAAEEAINIREQRAKKMQQELREKDETVAVLQAQAEVFKADFIAERDARTRIATDKDRLAQELEAEQLKNQGLTDQLTRYTQQQLHDMQIRASQGQGSPGSHFYHHPPYPYRNQAYGGGGGGDSSGGGGGGAGFNNLSGGEGLQAAVRQGHGEAEGGQNYSTGYYGGSGQGQAQHGGYNYPGVAGQQAGRYPMQGGSPGPQYHQQQQPQGRAVQHNEEEQMQQFSCPSCNHHFPDYDTLNFHVQDCLQD